MAEAAEVMTVAVKVCQCVTNAKDVPIDCHVRVHIWEWLMLGTVTDYR